MRKQRIQQLATAIEIGEVIYHAKSASPDIIFTIGKLVLKLIR